MDGIEALSIWFTVFLAFGVSGTAIAYAWGDKDLAKETVILTVLLAAFIGSLLLMAIYKVHGF